MKILQVIQFFTPARGGSVSVAYNLSKELAMNGHEVTIITTDFEFDHNYADSIRNSGVNVIPFKCFMNLSLFLYSPTMKKWLENNIESFDIIHMHNFRTYQNNVVHYYARKFNIPYIMQAHGSVMEFVRKKSLKKIYDVIWGYKLLKDAKKVVAVSNIEVDQYKEMGVSNDFIEIIPNPVDISKFKRSPNGAFRRENGIADNFKVILFLGRLNKTKGIDFLIKAFKTLLKDMENVILVIAGPEESYGKKLEEMVKKLDITDNVMFVGHVKNVSEAYSAADVLVYPSIYEIFGLVPFEALLCGTPVIVTEECACGEIINEAGCGLLVKYGDVEDLKDKIKYVLTSSNETNERVEKGKKYIFNNLNKEIIVKNMENLYRAVISYK
ncbi:MAG: glycosyltransferase family 4 protein [Methanobacterium sp.]|uniref:glycosyltransferase family 4 protein n=1 Tax=Methanobacterium sp. TaxID=2164 RepID=UPI003D64CFC7|nr:glycosyltransferase family 4 protein [Methanobacterium sp.]